MSSNFNTLRTKLSESGLQIKHCSILAFEKMRNKQSNIEQTEIMLIKRFKGFSDLVLKIAILVGP